MIPFALIAGVAGVAIMVELFEIALEEFWPVGLIFAAAVLAILYPLFGGHS